MNRPAPLYMRVMGDSWPQLAAPIRSLHATHSISRARGRVRIEHGRHLARLIARGLGLPRVSDAADTRLTITAREGREHWERSFDGRGFRTTQYEPHAGELAEQFGVLEFRFGLHAYDGTLLYIQREACVRGGGICVRLPAACAPRVEARVEAAGPACMQVSVRVVVPVIGLLISYAGVIDVDESPP